MEKVQKEVLVYMQKWIIALLQSREMNELIVHPLETHFMLYAFKKCAQSTMDIPYLQVFMVSCIHLRLEQVHIGAGPQQVHSRCRGSLPKLG